MHRNLHAVLISVFLGLLCGASAAADAESNRVSVLTQTPYNFGNTEGVCHKAGERAVGAALDYSN